MSMNRELKTRIDRYLLGDLPEAEQLAIEQHYFADAEMFEQVWAAENELVDRYVRGQLLPREAALFEGNYLQSPTHRARVASAGYLMKAVERRAPQDPAVETDRRAAADRSLTAGWFAGLGRSLGLKGALAAALIFLAALSSWLAIDRLRLNEELGSVKSELAQRQNGQGKIEQQLAEEKEREVRLRAEIGHLRQEALNRSSSSPLRDGSRIVSLVLSPVLLRGNGSRLQEVEITPATNWVRLEVPSEANGFTLFQATVRTPEGKEVWRRRSIQPESGSVILEIPARSLPAGDYIVVLSDSSSGDSEGIDRYPFRIIRK